ncbi:SDR family NAD(P)-dependent oxidoreductase [Gordonia sp. NPDC058843]|uniref:SDR family NAD(P)-dependent oxidoreductase n=1 Tax=Gordonia sp. NPDC058843 TaxID=3346648 RepID=UPI0036772E94
MTTFTAHSTTSDVLNGIDLAGTRFIVTGGGSGIGAEISRALSGAGAEVVVAVRDPSRVGRLSPRVRAEQLDLADLDSVRAFGRRWDGPLDALIANAGIMAYPDHQLDASGWEHHLAVNFLGHFALAGELHASLAAATGRLVVVSSGAHRDTPFDFDDPHFRRRTYDRWSAYGQSKTAGVLWAVAAAQRWAEDGITANALNPGWVMTGLQRHVDDATMRAMGAIDDDGNVITQPYSKTLSEGAAPSVLLAASPAIAEVTGRYFEDNQPAPVTTAGPTGVAPHAVDSVAAQRLWDLAAAAVHDSGR